MDKCWSLPTFRTRFRQCLQPCSGNRRPVELCSGRQDAAIPPTGAGKPRLGGEGAAIILPVGFEPFGHAG